MPDKLKEGVLKDRLFKKVIAIRLMRRSNPFIIKEIASVVPLLQ
jgi:hypothetical protein